MTPKVLQGRQAGGGAFLIKGARRRSPCQALQIAYIINCREEREGGGDGREKVSGST